MKSFLLSFFLLLSLSSFSQIREEIYKRYEDGSKSVVITYSGIGNAEKIVKVSAYNNHYLVPYMVKTYGSKIEDGRTKWGIVKVELFKNGGASEDQVQVY